MIRFNKLDNRKFIRPYLKKVKCFIKSGNYILDESVDKLEWQLEARFGYKHALGVSNGADGLYMALKSLNIGSGDEVITQGTAYNATVTAILRTGARPKFVDIHLDSWMLDWDKVEITKKTKAILPVWLYGIEPYSRRISPVPIIEDACQCLPHHTGNTRVHSFYPTKPIGSLGDAGAIFTDDDLVYERLRILRNLGQTKRNEHTLEGYNHRINSLQALFLSEKIDLRLNVQWIADRYTKAFLNKIKIPLFVGHNSYHIYPIRVNNRYEFCKKMLDAGIETAVHYPTIVYKQPFWKGKYDKCLNAEWLLEGIVSLPIYPTLKKKEVDYIIEKTLEYAR